MARPRKTDLDLLVMAYARMDATTRALARAAIQGAEAVLSLRDSKPTALSDTVQSAFAEMGAAVATEGE